MDDCKQQIKRKDFEQHVEQECEERLVKCPFTQYGCSVTCLKSKDLRQHLYDTQFEHISLKFDSITAKVESLSTMCLHDDKGLSV